MQCVDSVVVEWNPLKFWVSADGCKIFFDSECNHGCESSLANIQANYQTYTTTDKQNTAGSFKKRTNNNTTK